MSKIQKKLSIYETVLLSLLLLCLAGCPEPTIDPKTQQIKTQTKDEEIKTENDTNNKDDNTSVPKKVLSPAKKLE